MTTAPFATRGSQYMGKLVSKFRSVQVANIPEPFAENVLGVIHRGCSAT